MLEVGSKAPDFEAEMHDGETFRLSDNLGKRPVVIYFFTNAYGLT